MYMSQDIYTHSGIYKLTWNIHVAAMDVPTLRIPQAFHLALLTPLGFFTSHEVYNHIYMYFKHKALCL